ncbi:uncharacterized protein [Lepeophtheirus salmonis]|uniref:uncharacterized protein n=1 Tax=Lepeophtheirus salmonis TaxID=72036 RepID=UPI001AEAED96|nr:uncharacterized protein LOC121128043 [Lepeophtheirus salmonis]
MATPYISLLFLLCCAYSAFGLITEFECRNSYHNCRDLVETTDRACLIPSYQWTCPEDCGVCRARCKDFFAGCFDSSSLCLQSHRQKICPKSCASCDECEDIISPRLCEQYRGRCKTDISVIYACRETCGLCDDDCNDAFVQESGCTIFESRGYCNDPININFMKKACKRTCGLCQFDHC